MIHALRIACGWQVQELAKRAKLNPSVIYRIEDGRVLHPRQETLEKLAAAFGVTVRELRNAVPAEPMKFSAALPVTLKTKAISVKKRA